MIRSMRSMVSLVVLAAVVAPVAGAQGNADARLARAAIDTRAVNTAPPTAPDSTSVNATGPTVERAAAGVRAPKSFAPRPTPAPVPKPGQTRENEALMIVGGAALIVGAIIASDNHTAGTLFMVGGGIVGLYGLYKYLE